jgi:hypothetical protein
LEQAFGGVLSGCVQKTLIFYLLYLASRLPIQSTHQEKIARGNTMSAVVQRLVRVILFSIIVSSVYPLSTYAQETKRSPKTEIKATFGFSFFDEDSDDDRHTVWGGSFQYHLTPRVSIEPEFLYMHHSADDKDIVFTPNLAIDFRKPGKTFAPYGKTGVGVIHHWGKIKSKDAPNKDVVIDNSGTVPNFNLSFGVKIFLNDCFYISPELRFGFEPIMQLTVSGGYVVSERIK